jgi:hypothetical protein
LNELSLAELDEVKSVHSMTSQDSNHEGNESLQIINPEQGADLFEASDLVWDHTRDPLSQTVGTPDINIRTPTMEINIRTSDNQTTPRSLRTVRRGYYPRSHTGLNPRDLSRWVAESSPEHGHEFPESIHTRSGRTIRTPVRLIDEMGAARENRQIEVALDNPRQPAAQLLEPVLPRPVGRPKGSVSKKGSTLNVAKPTISTRARTLISKRLSPSTKSKSTKK